MGRDHKSRSDPTQKGNANVPFECLVRRPHGGGVCVEEKAPSEVNRGRAFLNSKLLPVEQLHEHSQVVFNLQEMLVVGVVESREQVHGLPQ